MATRRPTGYRRRPVRRRPAYRRRAYRRPSRRAYRRAPAQLAVHPRKELTGTGHGDKYIKSFINPFNDDVLGVKIPDSNAQPSIPLRCLDSFDRTVDATYGVVAGAFNACPQQNHVVSQTAPSSSSWTWAAGFTGYNNVAKVNNITTDQEMYRPVAHGIRITSGLAPTAATGFLHVCVFSQALYNQSTWTYPTSISQMQQVPGYKRVPLGRLTSEGLLVVNRPMDVTAQRYVDSDSPGFASAGTMEFQSGLQWCSIVYAVTGAPVSSTPITIESVLHIECIPRATAIGQATPAAKYNTGALGGASNAASKATSAVLDSEKGQRAAQVAQAAATGIEAVTGRAGMRISSLFRGLRGSDFSMKSAPSSGGIRNSAPSHSGML